ncbi:hypothetical protein BDZ94DRAFT_1350027 [Collybia nuda]|uniref:Uncharacterized protein n=1 Tax=Collybia nuda TaxID=64659 RepID=A0A9P5YAJ5_9AGAR|nr:hypothetical protein BDZ94DRAFT_1350027 [Collybia nuda]
MHLKGVVQNMRHVFPITVVPWGFEERAREPPIGGDAAEFSRSSDPKILSGVSIPKDELVDRKSSCHPSKTPTCVVEDVTEGSSKAPQVDPWCTFKHSRGIISEEVLASRTQLLNDLVELAEGTTVMGKPERTFSTFGPIASPESGSAKKRASGRLPDPLSPTPGTRHNQMEIAAPVPIVPISLLHKTFDILMATTALPASSYNPFDENCIESLSNSASGGNTPPRPFREI